MMRSSNLILGIALIGVLAGNLAADPAAATASIEKVRLLWLDDPARSAVIGWCQKSGEPTRVLYGKNGLTSEIKSIAKNRFDGFRHCFAYLNDLEPDTVYQLRIADSKGESRLYQFRTAPDHPQPFTFIAGGDSRNHRDVRIATNQTVAKLRPLFVAFTGDMINHDNREEWDEWLDDWEQTTSADGHLIPLVPHRGNHERRPRVMPMIFSTPPNAFYAFSIGGPNYFRYYALNSEIPAGGDQKEWLQADLSRHVGLPWLVAGYHKPMRPHVSRKSEGDNPMQWAEAFYHYGLDLSLESDSHVMKRTLPLRPSNEGSEGFVAAPGDKRATTYIGEGCWGAPLRAADDPKPWTLDCASFNGFDWIQVTPEEIVIKTVKVGNPASMGSVRHVSDYENPSGLKLWQAKGGELLILPVD